jgi:GTP cyclohydrolase II
MGEASTLDCPVKTHDQGMSGTILKARQMMTHRRRVIDVVVGGNMVKTPVTRTGVGRIETEVGDFWAFKFAVDDLWQEYHALVVAELNDELGPMFDRTRPIPVRIDSGCVTGQVYADWSCECADQLRLAMSRINRANQGVIITIPTQDGRGKGLAFKLATLYLQQHGMDTYDAAHALAGDEEIDVRTYGGAIAILKFLMLTPDFAIRVMTNNRDKLAAFAENGYLKVERYRILIDPNEHTAPHLAAKFGKMGHLG